MKTLVLIISIILTSLISLAGGPGGGTSTGPCAQQNTVATIVNCTNCTINDGTAAGPLGSDLPLSVTATGCGPVTIRVRYQFDWNQGSNYNWLHGISFNAGSLWTSSSFTPPAGWVYMPNGVTGSCSGNSYGPGYYYDASNLSSAPSTFQIQYVGPGGCVATCNNTSGCNEVCNSNENLLGSSTGSGACN